MQIDDILQRLNPKGPMTMAELEAHLKSAHGITISLAALYMWKRGVPELRQLELENLTGGRLRAGPECDRYRVPHVQRPAEEVTTPGALEEAKS